MKNKRSNAIIFNFVDNFFFLKSEKPISPICLWISEYNLNFDQEKIIRKWNISVSQIYFGLQKYYWPMYIWSNIDIYNKHVTKYMYVIINSYFYFKLRKQNVITKIFYLNQSIQTLLWYRIYKLNWRKAFTFIYKCNDISIFIHSHNLVCKISFKLGYYSWDPIDSSLLLICALCNWSFANLHLRIKICLSY